MNLQDSQQEFYLKTDSAAEANTLATLKFVKEMYKSGAITGDYYRRSCGICYNAIIAAGKLNYNLVERNAIIKTLQWLFPTWPEFSGSEYYPVKSDDPTETAGAAFMRNNLWIGEYGAARLRLLDYCIATLEKRV